MIFRIIRNRVFYGVFSRDFIDLCLHITIITDICHKAVRVTGKYIIIFRMYMINKQIRNFDSVSRLQVLRH